VDADLTAFAFNWTTALRQSFPNVQVNTGSHGRSSAFGDLHFGEFTIQSGVFLKLIC